MKSNAYTIAVFRGGKYGSKSSLSSGVHALETIDKYGFSGRDIYVDENEMLYHHGVLVNTHALFSTLDAYIDTTKEKNTPHHNLLSRMGVLNIGNEIASHMKNKDALHKILHMHNIATSDNIVIRHYAKERENYFKKAWKTLHIPLMVSPLDGKESSTLIYTYKDMCQAADIFLDNKRDVIVLSYTQKPVISTAVLPSFRGEEIYIPLSVITFPKKDSLPSYDDFPHLFRAKEDEYVRLKQLLKKTYTALGTATPMCIDVIAEKSSYRVVNVSLDPSLRADGRFMASLATTGVTLGNIIDAFLEKNKEKEKNKESKSKQKQISIHRLI